MAISELEFVPATGWNDPTAYPDVVTNSADVRRMLQSLHTQTQEYINTTVKPAIDSLQGDSISGSRLANNSVDNAKLKSGISAAKISGALTNATIDGSKVTGTIADAQMPTAITASKISGDLSNATIAGSKITGTVANAHIASGITASKISGDLSNATIAGSKITGTLSTSQLPSIPASSLATDSVTTAKIKDGNVTLAKTNFVETSLSNTSDAKVPTSKAVATYVGNNAPQWFMLVPISATPSAHGGIITDIPATKTIALRRPITVTGNSAIRISIEYYGFYCTTDDVYLSISLYGKNASGSNVTYNTPFRIWPDTHSENPAGRSGIATAYINTYGYGWYRDSNSSNRVINIINPAGDVPMPAVIESIIVKGSSTYTLKAYAIGGEICAVK
jgi:hypothetical protein